jgi:hypothetical protein
VIQKKTGRPVQFEITEQTRASIQDWLPSVDLDRGEGEELAGAQQRHR